MCVQSGQSAPEFILAPAHSKAADAELKGGSAAGAAWREAKHRADRFGLARVVC
jgi:hypothetical protein